MLINEKETIWFEKYRPQRIEDMILPENFKQKFQDFLKNPNHILLCSEVAGTGKTSLMNAIVKETGWETLFINASLERGIDVLNSKIKTFGAHKSFDGNKKIIVLDECDGFTSQAQDALRGTIEEFSNNCIFIITCNYINRLLPAIINRCMVFDFDEITSLNKRELINQIGQRLSFILKNEKIKFESDDIKKIIKTFYPSIRGIIGFLQKSIFNFELKLNEMELQTSEGFNFLLKIDSYETLISEIHKIKNPSSFYNWSWKNLKFFQGINVSKLIITLAKYQSYDAIVRDKNLNLGACLMEIMNLKD